VQWREAEDAEEEGDVSWIWKNASRYASNVPQDMPQTCLKQTAVQGSQRELFDSHESSSVGGRRIKGVVPPRRGKNALMLHRVVSYGLQV
jgi:hypothetical protein